MIWIGLDPGAARYATLYCPFCGMETDALEFGLKRECRQCRRCWHTVLLLGVTFGERDHQERMEAAQGSPAALDTPTGWGPADEE